MVATPTVGEQVILSARHPQQQPRVEQRGERRECRRHPSDAHHDGEAGGGAVPEHAGDEIDKGRFVIGTETGDQVIEIVDGDELDIAPDRPRCVNARMGPPLGAFREFAESIPCGFHVIGDDVNNRAGQRSAQRGDRRAPPRPTGSMHEDVAVTPRLPSDRRLSLFSGNVGYCEGLPGAGCGGTRRIVEKWTLRGDHGGQRRAPWSPRGGYLRPPRTDALDICLVGESDLNQAGSVARRRERCPTDRAARKIRRDGHAQERDAIDTLVDAQADAESDVGEDRVSQDIRGSLGTENQVYAERSTSGGEIDEEVAQIGKIIHECRELVDENYQPRHRLAVR